MLTARRFVAVPKSPLPGVSAAAWQRFVAALDVQPIGSVSESGGLGSYDLRPRRLVELGYARALRTVRTSSGRQIRECDFVLPWTQARFLSEPLAQYAALSRSMLLYQQSLAEGRIKALADVSLAGHLAILHVGGRGALEAWPNLFENTRALFSSAEGAF